MAFTWQGGLSQLVAAYLEEGLPIQGSLREALELAGSGVVAGSDSEDDDVAHLGYPHSDDGEDDIPFERQKSLSGLQMEKLRRKLIRWRRTLPIETSTQPRLCARHILKAIPSLMDSLEVLADYWQSQFHGRTLDHEFITGWLKGLVGNLLCIYASANSDVQKVQEQLRELDSKTPSKLGGKVGPRLTNLLCAETIDNFLVPAMYGNIFSSRLQAPALVFFLENSIVSKEHLAFVIKSLSAPTPELDYGSVLKLWTTKSLKLKCAVDRMLFQSLVVRQSDATNVASELLEAKQDNRTATLVAALDTRIGDAVSLTLAPETDEGGWLESSGLGEKKHSAVHQKLVTEDTGWRLDADDMLLNAEVCISSMEKGTSLAVCGLGKLVLDRIDIDSEE